MSNYKVECIISSEVLKNDFLRVEKLLNTYGEIYVVSGPVKYRISKCDFDENKKKEKTTLPEAISTILVSNSECTMHVKEIAERIAGNELYSMKNGDNVGPVQIRACANNNRDKFECLKGNYIRLKK